MISRIAFLITIMLWLPMFAKGQNNTIISPTISTLQVVAGDDWLSMPIIDLDGQNCINISFDDMSTNTNAMRIV